MGAIVVEDLTKTFRVRERAPGLRGALTGLVAPRSREVRALDRVSFRMEPGELVAYIGPNGAGKSTTVKVLSGILVPDSGRCTVDGRVPWEERRAHVARIGVVFGQRTQLWWDLPLRDSFELLRDIYRVPEARYRASRDELVERLDLGDLLDVPVRQLSLGQRMRGDLAASLLHEPAVLFLDEPTIGLDAASKLAVRDFVRALNRERGVSVILTTHDMDDIEALCRRVLVIGRGTVLADTTLDALRERVRVARRVVLDLEEVPPDLPAEGEDWGEVGARVLRVEGHRVELAFDPEETPAPELLAALGSRVPIRDLSVESAPVEEVVARLYEELA